MLISVKASMPNKRTRVKCCDCIGRSSRTSSRWTQRVLAAGAAIVLTACATIPPQLTQGGPFVDVTPQQAQSGNDEGRRVRWGGVIIEVTPKASRTCFEIMALKLDKLAEPRDSDTSLGRFVACADGFFEPALYTKGRYVTFTGTIDGIEKQKIGEYEYGFPRLNADSVYLWPKRHDVIYVPYPDPFWGPYWPYYWPHYRPPYYYR